jgi:hypothetical protein
LIVTCQYESESDMKKDPKKIWIIILGSSTTGSVVIGWSPPCSIGFSTGFSSPPYHVRMSINIIIILFSYYYC